MSTEQALHCEQCGVAVSALQRFCRECGALLRFSNYNWPEGVFEKACPERHDEEELVILGHQVMAKWETPLMELCAEVCTRSGGWVLEVGFGMGISASFIQRQLRVRKHETERHEIVEANEFVFQQLQQFAVQEPNKAVRPHHGRWERVLPHLEDASYDGILFDVYPTCEEEAYDLSTSLFRFFHEARRLLKSGGILTYYSNAHLELPRDHVVALVDAGFSEEDIKVLQCAVEPPATCTYYCQRSMVVPVVTKR